MRRRAAPPGLKLGCVGRPPRSISLGVSEKDPPVYEPRYPARQLLDLISDKWTPIILYCLSGGTRRFSELQRQIPDISKKMLVQVLRRLERDGVVDRTVYPVVPPKTEYRLTEAGERLHEPIGMLCDWAIENESLLRTIRHRREGIAGPIHGRD